MYYKQITILFNIVIISICVISVILLIFLDKDNPNQKFYEQAVSFVNGQLNITGGGDTVFFNGKYYWPQGPFPSIILIPFVAILGSNFNQVTMHFFLTFLLAFLVYNLTRSHKLDRVSSSYLTYAFLFGSLVIGIIVDAGNVYYSQLVSLCLLVYILWEFQNRRRWILLGLSSAALIATRPTSSLIILLLIYYASISKSRRIYNLAFLILPIVISIFLLLSFNYARFNNFFDNGYYTNYVGEALVPFRNMGIFNINHINTNFYYYFLSPLRLVLSQNQQLSFPFITYNTWGISFFIVSPIFLFTLKLICSRDRYIRLLWIICALTLLILLTYYAPGWVQFGPRYVGDLLPVLFIILLFYFKHNRLKELDKKIILLSSAINIFLLLSKIYLLSIGSFSFY